MKRLVLSRRMRRPMSLISGPDKAFVDADASLEGCGRMIAAGKSLETAKPILYHPRVFNPAHSNYSTHEQELLAVADILNTYYHLMADCEFTLLTDSQAMTSIFSQKHLSPRQSRWMLVLGQFPMKIEHIPGETKVITDLLSRIQEYSIYVFGSLLETVDVDVPDQDFESPVPTPLISSPITLRRWKLLLDTPVPRRRGPQSQKRNISDHPAILAGDQAATDTPSEIGDIPVTLPPESTFNQSLSQTDVPEALNFFSITIDKF
jgi:hypothetical protein